MAAWFPASDLLHQRQQLASASTQLARLRQENTQLNHKAARLRTPAEIARLAQEQDQLVKPGQQAYQVLPPSAGQAASPTATTGPAPATTTTTPAGGSAAGGTGQGGSASAQGAGGSPSFVSRVLHTLEFWR